MISENIYSSSYHGYHYQTIQKKKKKHRSENTVLKLNGRGIKFRNYYLAATLRYALIIVFTHIGQVQYKAHIFL